MELRAGQLRGNPSELMESSFRAQRAAVFRAPWRQDRVYSSASGGTAFDEGDCPWCYSGNCLRANPKKACAPWHSPKEGVECSDCCVHAQGSAAEGRGGSQNL